MKAALRASSRVARHEVSHLAINLPALARPVHVERPRCRTAVFSRRESARRPFTTTSRVRLDTAIDTPVNTPEYLSGSALKQLPITCPGCGAPTQFVRPTEAGFFSVNRAGVRRYLDGSSQSTKRTEAGEVFESSLHNAPAEVLHQLRLDPSALSSTGQHPSSSGTASSSPICDRCHDLVNHQRGVPIAHPTLQAIDDTIDESPHKRNQIYHILDAADFPMSLIPGITKRLSLAHLRTQNRRSKSHHYVAGREAELNFIITRSDLLAPKKEQVDRLFPTLVEILRDALGSAGKDVRLGNVRCVSSKRGWWTSEVKESIYSKGGAAWLVGKVNVGKSNFFEAVFPKNRSDPNINIDREREAARRTTLLNAAGKEVARVAQSPSPPTPAVETNPFANASSLLPPPQPEVPYPVMPVISSLPGTTASPIRIPFGQGKGELIDLPGLSRNTLEPFFRPSHRLDLVMKSRIAPERLVLKPGSSLLLSGLLRITPLTPDVTVMAHAFVPLDPHVTATAKAEAYQSGARDMKAWTSALLPGWQDSIRSAGTFALETDVTKAHAGPLTRKDDVGLATRRLPFVVYATDILIEGCGWVELVAQLRKGRVDHSLRPRVQDGDGDALSHLERGLAPRRGRRGLEFLESAPLPDPPVVEVWSPNGLFVGQRRALNSWLDNRHVDEGGKRPRRSMKGGRRP